jgi:hypothetical protein
MMEAVRTPETLDDNNFKRQYIPEDNSEFFTWLFVYYGLLRKSLTGF